MITVSNALDESPATVEDALPAALPRYQAGLDLRAAATRGMRRCGWSGAMPVQ